jgi:PKD repeat protein
MVQLFGQGEDDDGSIALYEWDFDGNGIYDWSSEDSGIAEFRYSSEGTYNAVLRVTDNDGYSSTSTMTISVEPASRIGQIAGIEGKYILGAALLIAIGIATAGYLMKRDSYVPPPASKRQSAPQFKPETGLTDIECPGCNGQMKVPKLGKMQTVTCDSCGLSGEIEV